MNILGFVKNSAGGFLVAGALFISPALADSISPTSFTTTLDVGESVTIHKTVTVSAGEARTKADIVFLSDTTGSMGGAITAVRNAASDILTATAALGDIAWGVSEFKDGDFGASVPPNTSSYRVNSGISTVAANTTAGLALWGASGGGDFPEQFLHALTQVTDTADWRVGAEKVIVLFGDATAHDPGTGGETLASTIADLTSAGVTVIAFDIGGMNGAGQVTPITTATGGSYNAGLGSDPAAAVIAAISSALETYSSVCLDVSAAPAGVTETSVPLCINGSFDRSIERTFEYDVTFTGVAEGHYVWDTEALVDGGLVASEREEITVGDGPVGVPEPMTLLVFGVGLAGLGVMRRRQAA